MSKDDLARIIQVNSIVDTDIIEIKVENTNPELAASIADVLAAVFMEKIVDLLNIDNIQILDMAEVPTTPIKPKFVLNAAIAIVLGLGLGVGLIFFLEYLDDTIKSQEDIKTHLKLPVLTSVPKQHDINLVTYSDPKSFISEAYRVLRTNIQFSSLDEEIKTIAITSSAPSEGKSTIISNLAITMVSMGYKTLIIDADFRRPRLHKIFDLENDFGLTNVLMGEWLENTVMGVPLC